MRRTLTAAFWLAATIANLAPVASRAQQDYPNRVVKIVNPYVAGSTTDILARALAVGLSSRLGQQFIIENKPGAGGALGTASVARADADGYTLLFAPALVLSVYPQSRADTGYTPDSLVPVCQTFTNAMALAVRPDFPIKSVADLVAAAKQKPGALNYGHQGIHTIPHLAMEEFLQNASVDIKDIPFRGEPLRDDRPARRPPRRRLDRARLGKGPERARHRCLRRDAPPRLPRRTDREGTGL